MHSGDSACVIPPLSIGPELEAEMRRQTELLARGLGVRGLVQRAVRAARGHDLRARGQPAREPHGAVREQGDRHRPRRARLPGARSASASPTSSVVVPEPMIGVAVKEVVLPFARFPGSDPVLGPEMRSTGEVMALAPDFATTYAKASRAAGMPLPSRPNGHRRGGVPLGLRPRQVGGDAARAAPLRSRLRRSCATPGTARRDRAARHRGDARSRRSATRRARRPSSTCPRRQRVDLIVNTPGRPRRARRRLPDPARRDLGARARASRRSPAQSAAVQAIGARLAGRAESLQELHAALIAD